MLLGKHLKTAVWIAFAFIYFGLTLHTLRSLPFLGDDIEMIQKGALLFEFPSSVLEPDLAGRNHILWYIFLGILYQVFGLIPFVYYFCNLLFHGLTACLIAAASRRLGVGSFGAWISAFFFLVLSYHFPIVGWIGEMCRAMMLFFLLASFLLFDTFRKTAVKKFLFLSLGAWFLAMNCIEEAIMLPVLLIGYDLFVRRQKIPAFFSKKEMSVYFPFFLLMLLCVISQKALYSYGVHDNLVASPAWKEKILGIAWGVSAILIPRREALEWFTNFPPTLAFRLLVAAVCFLPFVAGLLNPDFWKNPRNRSILIFSLWWFAVISFPFMLLPTTTDSWTDYKPRYLYAPSAALAFFAGAFVESTFARIRKIRRLPLRLLSTAAILLSCVYFYSYNLWAFTHMTRKWTQGGRLHSFSVWVPWGNNYSGSPALSRMLYESKFPLKSPEIQERANQ